MVFLDRHNTLALRLYTEFDLNIKDMDTRNEEKASCRCRPTIPLKTAF
mgnify:CR=1 FL=1